MKRLVLFFLAALVTMWALVACGATPAPPINETQADIPTIPETGNSQLEAGTAVFTIVPSESTARFELEEDLRSARTGWALGARITVVGTADQISGEFQLDPADPTTAQFSTIRIDARTFYTDEFVRTRTIRNRILNTDTYPFITFTPTEITGLPDSVQLGESVTFNISGDLTIQDITHAETFEVTAAFLSSDQITGTASAIIPRDKYNLIIPSVANVTFVEDNVELYLDFVARSP